MTAVERAVNSVAPRTVAEGIRLENARTVSDRELIITYSLISVRVAEIEAELWEERFRPMIVHNVRRAEEQETRGLFEAEVTVNYRYVDCAGQLIVQIDVSPQALPGDPGAPSNN